MIETLAMYLLGSTTMTLNTWLINGLTSVAVTCTGIVAKAYYDEYKRHYELKRDDIKAKSILNSFNAINLKEPASYVPNEEVIQDLFNILELDIGGLFVFGAPAGAGKTTYLNVSLRKFQCKYKDRRRIYYISGLTPKSFEVLGIPPGRMYHEFLPTESIIIIDQVDNSQNNSVLSKEIEELLVQLATQSRNSRAFHVILVISNPEVMKIVLTLNGGEKIYSAVKTQRLKWSYSRLLALARCLLPHWADDDRSELVGKLTTSGCCGLLSKYPKNLRNIPPILMNYLNSSWRTVS